MRFDHMVWELAEWRESKPEDTDLQFLITLTPLEFAARRQRRIGRLPLFAQTIVEGEQPYRRPFRPDPLWTLQYLDNRDKHKTIIVTKSHLTHTATTGRSGVPYSPMLATGGFEDGKEIARVPYDPPTLMDVNFYPTFGITFEERSWIFTGPGPFKVEHVSANMILRVERIVERMERAFRIHEWLRPSKR